MWLRSWFDKLTTNGFSLCKGYSKKENALKVVAEAAVETHPVKVLPELRIRVFCVAI